MHVRLKFDGGKQINRSQEGSWQGRCAGAALRMSEGADWGPVYWEKIAGLPPSSTFTAVTTKACETLAKDRKRKSTMKEKTRRKKCERSDNSLQSRLDYSRYDNCPNAVDVPSDIPPKELNNLMISYYSGYIKITEAAATKLSIDTIDQGDSIAWHEERKK